jgi:hypothetical protein
MSAKTDLLKNLRVASPCNVGWERMTGDSRVRFCDSCQLNVYNFSEMTAREIELLVMKTEGRICGRMYRKTDGTILTRDCPVGLRALRRRISRTAGAVFATVLSLWSVAFPQSKRDKSQSCEQVSSLQLERKKSDDNTTKFTGVIMDPLRAVINNAETTLLTKSGAKLRIVKTDDNGHFSFEGLVDGVYTLKINSPGFKTLTVKNFEIKKAEAVQAQIVLNFVDSVEVVGVLVTSPDIESSNGTTIIRGDFIRKLPINN